MYAIVVLGLVFFNTEAISEMTYRKTRLFRVHLIFAT